MDGIELAAAANDSTVKISVSPGTHSEVGNSPVAVSRKSEGSAGRVNSAQPSGGAA